MALEQGNRKRGQMDIQDLGEINAPVLLFGGVYGNLQALEAVGKVARVRGPGGAVSAAGATGSGRARKWCRSG